MKDTGREEKVRPGKSIINFGGHIEFPVAIFDFVQRTRIFKVVFWRLESILNLYFRQFKAENCFKFESSAQDRKTDPPFIILSPPDLFPI